MKMYYKIIRETKYHRSVEKYCTQRKLWGNVFKKVGDLLGETIEKMVLRPEVLCIDLNSLTKEENKKLFGKNGKLKSNTKKAKNILEQYKKIVLEEGLADYRQLSEINFIHGIMRFHGEDLTSFVTSENDIYYEASFDLAKRSNGLVEAITEIEYQEKYLELLKMVDSQ